MTYKRLIAENKNLITEVFNYFREIDVCESVDIKDKSSLLKKINELEKIINSNEIGRLDARSILNILSDYLTHNFAIHNRLNNSVKEISELSLKLSEVCYSR